jgi:hypothetical protein
MRGQVPVPIGRIGNPGKNRNVPNAVRPTLLHEPLGNREGAARG